MGQESITHGTKAPEEKEKKKALFNITLFTAHARSPPRGRKKGKVKREGGGALKYVLYDTLFRYIPICLNRFTGGM